MQSSSSYRHNKFLNQKLCRLLCKSLIQLDFHCPCISWYPLVSQKKFCLKLNSRYHIRAKTFIEINSLPTKERVKQSISIKFFKN